MDGHWLLFTLKGGERYFLHVADEDESIVSAINAGALAAVRATLLCPESVELTPVGWSAVASYLAERGVDCYAAPGVLRIATVTGMVQVKAGPT